MGSGTSDRRGALCDAVAEHEASASPRRSCFGRAVLPEAHPVGEVFCAPLDIVLSQHDVVEPDVFYISHERAAKVLTPENARGAPELVIEIASKSTRRRTRP